MIAGTVIAMNKGMAPQYLSLAGLCTYASVSKSTVRGWLKMGLPYYRIGGAIRIKMDEFEEWMRQFHSSGTPKSLNLDELWDQTMEEAKCQRSTQ